MLHGPARPYFDCEWYPNDPTEKVPTGWTEEQTARMHARIMKAGDDAVLARITDATRVVCGPGEMVIATAASSRKRSYHMVYRAERNGNIVSIGRSTWQRQQFRNAVMALLPPEYQLIVDGSVYTKNRNMRLLGAPSPKDPTSEDRRLTPHPGSPQDPEKHLISILSKNYVTLFKEEAGGNVSARKRWPRRKSGPRGEDHRDADRDATRIIKKIHPTATVGAPVTTKWGLKVPFRRDFETDGKCLYGHHHDSNNAYLVKPLGGDYWEYRCYGEDCKKKGVRRVK